MRALPIFIAAAMLCGCNDLPQSKETKEQRDLYEELVAAHSDVSVGVSSVEFRNRFKAASTKFVLAKRKGLVIPDQVTRGVDRMYAYVSLSDDIDAYCRDASYGGLESKCFSAVKTKAEEFGLQESDFTYRSFVKTRAIAAVSLSLQTAIDAADPSMAIFAMQRQDKK